MVKRDKRALDREALLEQMGKLACAKVNDAVKLAYLPEEERDAIGRLDLSALTEFRRSGAGTVEMKFTDRMRALERLLELSGFCREWRSRRRETPEVFQKTAAGAHLVAALLPGQRL